MSVFESASFDGHEMVAFREDPETGLKAIIAVHNTHLGPALGGCRMYPYSNSAQALDDVLRLSRGMTYKSALAGLPLGGGKSVIIGDPHTQKTPALMRAMGEFIDSLGGQYIGAEDSGTGVADIRAMSEKTQYVSGITEGRPFGGDPSPYTAMGVFHGIQAAVTHRLGRSDLSGVRVALQGAGSVGRHLLNSLVQAGARVWFADTNADNARQAEALGGEPVSVDDILSLDADVLAPCAMGGAINTASIAQIKAPIIAGAANNQLAEPSLGETLRARDILYAPDFVINAGGIIDVFYQREGRPVADSEAQVRRIGTVLTELFERAERESLPTSAVAERMAEELLQGRGGRVSRVSEEYRAAV